MLVVVVVCVCRLIAFKSCLNIQTHEDDDDDNDDEDDGKKSNQRDFIFLLFYSFVVNMIVTRCVCVCVCGLLEIFFRKKKNFFK